jgi:dinuclear metal center YbgI/SA1388 family protein
MQVRDFIQIIHHLAPPDLAYDWDNSGLQAGSPGAEVKKIGLALDATSKTVAEAIDSGCDLLFTHHPLIFKPLKNISFNSMEGAILSQAIGAGLSIFSAHTNWDAAATGVADALAGLLELEERQPLEARARDFYKLAVFVPKGYEARLKNALFEAGAGSIGDYDRCWFSAPGEGGFRVPPDASPFIGEPGSEARVSESRLEVIVPKALADEAARAIFKIHPYQEPAFEFYPIRVYGRNQGIGLIGHWPYSRDPVAECREKLGLTVYRCAGPEPGRVKNVALLPGSGGSYIRLAKARGADVLITGDVGYHQALEAEHLGLTVLDLGHYETEWPSILRLKDILTKEFIQRNEAVECRLLTQKSPWRYA